MPGVVYAVATMDTKGHELAFVAERLRAAGAAAVTVDVGVKDPPTVPPDVGRERVAAWHPGGAAAVLGHTDRGRAVTAMAEALVEFLRREHAAGAVAGVLGLGGSGGTALIAPALRALPIGLPKLLVSTVASGNTAPYVGCCDVALMPSVVDVAGLNAVSREVLANAAHALAGMIAHRAGERRGSPPPSSTIGLTMFGVTTPCVTAVRALLEADGFDCLTFHATGTRGAAAGEIGGGR